MNTRHTAAILLLAAAAPTMAQQATIEKQLEQRITGMAAKYEKIKALRADIAKKKQELAEEARRWDAVCWPRLQNTALLTVSDKDFIATHTRDYDTQRMVGVTKTDRQPDTATAPAEKDSPKKNDKKGGKAPAETATPAGQTGGQSGDGLKDVARQVEEQVPGARVEPIDDSTQAKPTAETAGQTDDKRGTDVKPAEDNSKYYETLPDDKAGINRSKEKLN